MEELRVRFDHSFRASQKFSNNANWLGGGKPLRGSSTATPCSWNVRVPAMNPQPPARRPAHPLPLLRCVYPGCCCSQPDEPCDSSSGLATTNVRGFDTDTLREDNTFTDGRVVYDPEDTVLVVGEGVVLGVVDNHTKWRSFSPGFPAFMTVRDCTPPHPSATRAVCNHGAIYRHTTHVQLTLHLTHSRWPLQPARLAATPRARHTEAISYLQGWKRPSQAPRVRTPSGATIVLWTSATTRSERTSTARARTCA